jgi:nucleoid-associated protein YgaU
MPLPNLPVLPRPASATDGQQIARAETAVAMVRTPSAAADPVQVELQKAQNRTGLSDAQLQQMQTAQDRLAAGDSNGALLLLQALNQQLQSETRSYVVQSGESLWHVAGQPEVYGNSYLWPLVWEANKNRVKQPYQLYKGLRLTIPAHPTVQEVTEALAYAKKNGADGLRPAAEP